LDDKRPFEIYEEPQFQSSSLVVGWTEDSGKLGSEVISYLHKKLWADEFAEIEPADFFPLDGVSIIDDVAHISESKFYYCQEMNLVFFPSSPPRAEWYRFLNSVLDVAEQYCHVKELYTVGGIVSLEPHTAPRELLAVANSPEMKKALSRYDLSLDMNYQTPPGQRPTLSSYLLWMAKKRSIPGASLWVPIPFYLMAVEDPQAWKEPLKFFDQRFALGLDFTDLDEEIERQNEQLAQLRACSPEIDSYIRRLEIKLSLTEEENEKLVKEVEEFLRKRD
jgi:proteasome assembly chaperone (PAC2) family protein